MTRKPPPRLRCFDYTGFRRYFLTICTHHRARVFIEDDRVAVITAQLTRIAAAERFSVTAYCLMPDHIHGLVEGQHDAADFRKFVRMFKQQSSFHWKRTCGATLWQRSYFEHVLRDDEDGLRVAKYILENPLRAGLVARVEDYPYLGSMTLTVRDLLYSIQL